MMAYGSRVALGGGFRMEAAMSLGRITGSFLFAALLAGVAGAQEAHSHSGDAETLGTVRFPVTCSGEVSTDWTRAVALLHSFGYEEARKAFAAVAQADPGCGMASWGIAMTYYHPIWAPPAASALAAVRSDSARPR